MYRYMYIYIYIILYLDMYIYIYYMYIFIFFNYLFFDRKRTGPQVRSIICEVRFFCPEQSYFSPEDSCENWTQEDITVHRPNSACPAGAFWIPGNTGKFHALLHPYLAVVGMKFAVFGCLKAWRNHCVLIFDLTKLWSLQARRQHSTVDNLYFKKLEEGPTSWK